MAQAGWQRDRYRRGFHPGERGLETGAGREGTRDTSTAAASLSDEIGPEWRLVEGGGEGEKERVTTLRGPMGGKTTKGGEYHALTIHIAGHPILIVITNSFEGLDIGISPDRVQGQFGWRNFHITEANRATLDQDTYDLTRGRVFLQGSDGTFRQVAGRPDRILSGEDLKKFVENLPSE